MLRNNADAVPVGARKKTVECPVKGKTFFFWPGGGVLENFEIDDINCASKENNGPSPNISLDI